MAFGYKQQGDQLSSQQEVDVELLKVQINSFFKVCNRVVQYMKSGKVDQEELASHNDCAVALLDAFGAVCQDLGKKGENENTLIAAWCHFDSVREKMDKADAKLVQSWLNYAECALLAKPLKEIKILQSTIKFGEKNMKQNLGDFMQRFLGSNHKTQRTVQDAEKNAKQYRKDNEKAVQGGRDKYLRRQKVVECPSQNSMYNVSGGGQNMKFGSALYTQNSKYSQPKNETKDDNDDDSDMMDKDNNNKQKPNEYDFVNAYVIKKPPQTLKRNKKAVKDINYPYPCQIVPGVSYNNGQTLGVKYARPNDDLTVRVDVTNLERNPFEVSRLEQEFVKQMKYGLGYKTIAQQQQFKQSFQ